MVLGHGRGATERAIGGERQPRLTQPAIVRLTGYANVPGGSVLRVQTGANVGLFLYLFYQRLPIVKSSVRAYKNRCLVGKVGCLEASVPAAYSTTIDFGLRP